MQDLKLRCRFALKGMTLMEMKPCCNKCGADDLIGPDEMTDESIITCEAYGAEVGTWGEVQAACMAFAEEKAAQDLQGTLGQAFEHIDGISFKKTEE